MLCTSKRKVSAMQVLTKRIDKIVKVKRGTLAHKQQRVFRKLIAKAKDTEFGKQYHFDRMLNADYNVSLFQKNVPVFNYETMYRTWWRRVKRGDRDTCWPGVIRYFALSSGTTEGSSKYIPVSKQMIRSLRNIGLRHATSLKKWNVFPENAAGQVLMVGGSTHLLEDKGRYFGDMSGIQALTIMPKWFVKKYYRPGYEISNIRDWDERVEAIVRNADKWNIGVICGMPNWVVLILQKIMEHYRVESIHEIWPDLKMYVHGGVYIDPYKDFLDKCFSGKVLFAETYMASEGYFGYSTRSSNGSIKLLMDEKTFFEFIPHASGNFEESGLPQAHAPVYTIGQVETDVDYVVVISNNSGAWRYVIGDVIRFTDVEKGYIQIVGRLKHTLNICGEHVSVDNLRAALTKTVDKLGLVFPEFTVYPVSTSEGMYHQWFIAAPRSWEQLSIAERLDVSLSQINDDYRIAREANLLAPKVKVVRPHVFNNWMAMEGKSGGQNKLPAVLNSTQFSGLCRHVRFKINTGV